MTARMFVAVAFYLCLLILTTTTIVWTCWNYPLFPLQTDDLDWSVAWLAATVVDYYGSTLCFAAIVWKSTNTKWTAAVWIAAFMLLGSPTCCIWMLVRLMRRQSLSLQESNNNDNGSSGGERQHLSSISNTSSQID